MPTDWRADYLGLCCDNILTKAIQVAYNDTMQKKHKKIFDAIFHDPVLENIAWRDIEKLFSALGADIEEGRGSRVTVTLNDEIAVFHSPHPQKETVKGAVKAVREFLILTGVERC